MGFFFSIHGTWCLTYKIQFKLCIVKELRRYTFYNNFFFVTSFPYTYFRISFSFIFFLLYSLNERQTINRPIRLTFFCTFHQMVLICSMALCVYYYRVILKIEKIQLKCMNNLMHCIRFLCIKWKRC